MEAAGAREAWWSLRERHPDEFRPPADEVCRWHEGAAAVCDALGLWRESGRHLSALVDAAPGRADYRERRGLHHFRLRRWDRAADDFTAALERGGESGLLWFRRGTAHGRLGRWDRAAEDFDRAARRLARNWVVWQQLGIARAQVGRLDEALEDLGQAVWLRPNARGCWAERARVHALLGRWREAAADFARSAVLGHARPWTHYLVGQRLGDGAGARRWLDRARDWVARVVPSAALPWYQRLEMEVLRDEAEAGVTS